MRGQLGGPIGGLQEPLESGELVDRSSRSSPPSFMVVSGLELVNR